MKLAISMQRLLSATVAPGARAPSPGETTLSENSSLSDLECGSAGEDSERGGARSHQERVAM